MFIGEVILLNRLTPERLKRRAWVMGLALLLGLSAQASWSAQAARIPQAMRTQKHIEALNVRAFKAYQANRYEQAAQSFLRAANAGNLLARYNLASMRFREETQVISKARALEWVRLSSLHGLADAQYALAVMHDLGQGVPQDLKAAAYGFEQAAQQGHADALLAMATIYFLGRGRALDYQRAAFWYELAANAGDVAAQYSLASMYLKGLGVEQNTESALLWFKAAARQGDIVAREQARLLLEQRSATHVAD